MWSIIKSGYKIDALLFPAAKNQGGEEKKQLEGFKLRNVTFSQSERLRNLQFDI